MESFLFCLCSNENWYHTLFFWRPELHSSRFENHKSRILFPVQWNYWPFSQYFYCFYVPSAFISLFTVEKGNIDPASYKVAWFEIVIVLKLKKSRNLIRGWDKYNIFYCAFEKRNWICSINLPSLRKDFLPLNKKKGKKHVYMIYVDYFWKSLLRTFSDKEKNVSNTWITFLSDLILQFFE